MTKEGEVRRARDVGHTDNRGSGKLIWRICAKCKEGKWIQLRAFSKLCHICFLTGRRGANHPTWKGGRYRVGYGYLSVQLPPTDKYYKMAKKDGYVVEHRLIMARHLGRCLSKGEIVHHLNGVTDDNRLENLALVNHKTHPHRTMVLLLQEHILKLERQLEEL
ncbi:hypothetical protein LCGC14_2587900 [marine sediment metagenome]|uniref:HNH nuclease domain-containing protein n=1 Tax=marine sediment metagenome TaxID=412755 RepID=A0A0F9CNN1_9ZZZZ